MANEHITLKPGEYYFFLNKEYILRVLKVFPFKKFSCVYYDFHDKRSFTNQGKYSLNNVTELVKATDTEVMKLKLLGDLPI